LWLNDTSYTAKLKVSKEEGPSLNTRVKPCTDAMRHNAQTASQRDGQMDRQTDNYSTMPVADLLTTFSLTVTLNNDNHYFTRNVASKSKRSDN